MDSRCLAYGSIDRLLQLPTVHPSQSALKILECAISFKMDVIAWNWQPFLHVLGDSLQSFKLSPFVLPFIWVRVPNLNTVLSCTLGLSWDKLWVLSWPTWGTDIYSRQCRVSTYQNLYLQNASCHSNLDRCYAHVINTLQTHSHWATSWRQHHFLVNCCFSLYHLQAPHWDFEMKHQCF